MLELIQKIKTYTEAGIILEHMELFDDLKEKWVEAYTSYDAVIFEFIKDIENRED